MIALGAAISAVLFGVIVAIVVGDPFGGALFGGGIFLGAVGAVLGAAAIRGARPIVGAAVDESAAGWTEFHRELARARRFGRPFTIVRFANGGRLDDATATSLREIAAAARRIDRVWSDEGHILMLLPETAPSAVPGLLERIRLVAPDALAAEPSVVHFPDHGTTSGALIGAIYAAGVGEIPTPISAARPGVRPAAGARDSDSDIPADDVAASGSG